MGCPDVTGAVAIAGLGVVSAAGDGASATLEAVKANRIAVEDCPRYLDGPYMTHRVGAVPDGVWDLMGGLDSSTGGSRTFRLAQRALSEAIRQAGASLAALDARRVGLVLSTTKAEIDALGLLVSGGQCSDSSRRHTLASRLAVDLASECQARGPIQCVSVACISGLLAIQQGARLIRAGLADAVLVAGVDVLSHFVLAGFSALKSLDPRGCRPFDKGRQGLSLGEGAGAVVMMRSDRVPAPLATLTGWGVSNDANHLTGPSRDGSGLALAVQRALRMAGRAPESIDCINAHGTGTVYNDRMEALAFKTVFGDRSPWVSASKGLFGHTLGAAGVMESVLCILAARARVVPGTPGFIHPDEEAPVRLAALPQGPVSYGRILKTNSGFGGTNSALVLEVPSHDD
jgi:3-oxoacyl-[acyl-carrier-protein] synthase II